jgi:predicted esterase
MIGVLLGRGPVGGAGEGNPAVQFHRFVVLILVLLSLSSACGSSAEPATTTAAPTSTTAAPATSTADVSPEVPGRLVYGTWGEELLTLSMYAPAESGEWPVVIFFHGRAVGSPLHVFPDLVAHGAIVFDVEYPFGHHPRIPAEELIADRGAGHRAIAESAACAIHYALARASEQGSESPVVVLAGHSQGGGVAAIAALSGSGIEARWEEYAVAQGGPPRQVDCEITDGSTHVDAFVGLAGTYSVNVGFEEFYGRDFMQARDPDLWEFLYGSIGENPDLRVRLLHGETDTVVPYNESAAFEVVLAEAGYDVRLIPFDGGHGNLDLLVPTIIDAIQP